MISRVPVSVRVGFVSGFWVGLLVAGMGAQAFLEKGTDTCPTVGALDALLAGIVAGVIFALLMSLLHVVLFCYPMRPILGLGLIVGILIGATVGPLSHTLKTPWVASAMGALLGAFIGWLLFWVLCGSTRRGMVQEDDHA